MSGTTRVTDYLAGGAWVPGEQERQRSRLLRALKKWGFSDLNTLFNDALEEPEWFWRAVVDDLDIAFSTPFDRVLDASEGKQFPRWFVGRSHQRGDALRASARDRSAGATRTRWSTRATAGSGGR